MTASSDDAAPVESKGEVRSSADSTRGSADKPRRTGRVQRRSERAAALASDTSDVVEAPAAARAQSSTPVADDTIEKPAPRRRASRRAAASTGAPTTAGQAQVMTVEATLATASVDSESAVPAASDSGSVHTSGGTTSSASGTASQGLEGAGAPKRARRRAGSSAGAPVTLQPVDLTATVSAAAPLTKPAAQTSGSSATGSSPVKDASEATQTPARKKRARVSAPAGAPTSTPEASA